MLSVENISYQVGIKKLLDDVSMEFEPGKMNLIIGPNGAGKSTLIKIICNQIQPNKGMVLYGGENIIHFSSGRLAAIRAVLSQNIEVAFPLTVREIVMMGRYPHFTGKPNPLDIKACEEAMDFFDVSDMADRNYLTLSGGEKQRTHFARVAAQIWWPSNDNTRYLILDEPLTFLDVFYQFDFMNKLVSLMKQHHMVIVGVVHDLNLAAKYADYLVLLHQGKVLASGKTESVLTKSTIKTAYQLEPDIHMYQGSLRLIF
ncbi:MAG: heme ABC transporter ATP-binding protein [Saprospiraceae bacterium]